MMRLNATHRELLHASEDTSRLAELVERHGIVQLGRFVDEYRQLFGERPRDTLAS